jgi:hypothetical protein
MGYSPKSLLAALLFATASCMAQPPSSEDNLDKAVKQNEERINAVIQLNIPRIEWNNVTYDEAWGLLEELIRSVDPTGKGVKLFTPERVEDEIRKISPTPAPQEISLPEASEPSSTPVGQPEPTNDSLQQKPEPIRVWTNARDIKVADAISYLSEMKYYRYTVAGVGTLGDGIYFSQPVEGWGEQAEIKVPASVHAFVNWRKLTDHYGQGWLNSVLGWKEQILFDAKLEERVQVQWKNGDTVLALKAPTQEIWKLRRHIASLEDTANNHWVTPLNKGELKLIETIKFLSSTKLENLEIDAPTLGEALEQLRTACRKIPGTKEAFLKWPFLQPKLASFGPVSLKLERGSAAALFSMLFDLGCKFGAHPDGRWGITARQMEDREYFIFREFRAPPSLFKDIAARKTKNVRKEKVVPRAASDPMTNSARGSTLIGPAAFAMYSPATSTLIVKNTAEELLCVRHAIRKAILEDKSLAKIWLEPVSSSKKKR